MIEHLQASYGISDASVAAGKALKATADSYGYSIPQGHLSFLEERGFRNSGVTLTRVVDSEGNRSYTFPIHHGTAT